MRTGKSIFYHIPRTGGMWVKSAVRHSGVPYDRAKRVTGYKNRLKMYNEHSPPDGILDSEKEGRLSYCFVRHPIDWYKSFWSFRVASGHVQLRNPLDFYCWDNVFEKFVANALIIYPNGYVTELYQLFVGENRDKVDFIGRQENLLDDLLMVLKIAGEEFDEDAVRSLGKKNTASDARSIVPRLGLSDYTRDMVLRTEKWVLENFYA